MPLHSLVDFLLLSAIWGASFLFMHLAVGEFGTLPTAALRVAIAAAFLLPLVAWKGQLAVLRRHWRPVLFVGLLNSAIPFALYCFALQSLSTGLAAILNAATPLFGAVTAWAWLKERPNASRIVGWIVGFAGVALLAGGKASFTPGPSGIAPAWAVLASLGACVCYGLSASFAKRYLAGLPPLVTATGSQVGATLALALPALAWLPPKMPGGTECTGSSVAAATPITPMKGAVGNVMSSPCAFFITPSQPPRRDLRTGVKTDTLRYFSGSDTLASGSGFGPAGNSPGSAPLPWRLLMTPYGTRGDTASTSTFRPSFSIALRRLAKSVVVRTLAGSFTRSRVKKTPSATAAPGAAAAATASGLVTRKAT